MKFSVNEIVIVLFHNVLIEALVVSRFVEDTPYGPKAFYEVELKDPSLSDGQTVTLEDCSVFRHPVVGDALSTESKINSSLHREICVILDISDAIEVTDDGEVNDFPFRPEDGSTEHKMSWVYDNETGQPNETSQSNKILKTVCAFMNRYVEQGESHLYIGTDEKRRRVSGIQPDIDFLIAKGELKAQGDVNDEYCRHILDIIKRRLPESYQYVHPTFLCDGRVLDLCISPAVGGVVYLDGTAYYRYGPSSREMPEKIREEIGERKLLHLDDMTAKVDAVRRAISTGRVAVLKGYDSSNSNTVAQDRPLEVFAFVDNGRFDAVWAFDYAKDRRNKVFLLRRADSVEVLDRKWTNEKHHKPETLDMFGFYGTEHIDFKIILKTTRAKNTLVERYPDARQCLEILPDNRWRVSGVLLNRYSLDAACSFYLGLADDVDISDSPEFRQFVYDKIASLIEKI